MTVSFPILCFLMATDLGRCLHSCLGESSIVMVLKLRVKAKYKYSWVPLYILEWHYHVSAQEREACITALTQFSEPIWRWNASMGRSSCRYQKVWKGMLKKREKQTNRSTNALSQAGLYDSDVIRAGSLCYQGHHFAPPLSSLWRQRKYVVGSARFNWLHGTLLCSCNNSKNVHMLACRSFLGSSSYKRQLS